MWKKLFCLICGLSVSTSYTSIVIIGTRVIYSAEKKVLLVQVTNDNNNPALIQS
ncbi:fimbria/pilus periplasmic chaperone [Gallibacterium genomosp. 3]|uniref:fimbria/pilus periplasmic chaperone n=1 Tax=Gallibacterium genomosp. 3 TaxID=505345 RepID=UPI0009F431A1